MLFMAKSNHRRKDLVDSFKSSLSKTEDGDIADESLKLVQQDNERAQRSPAQSIFVYGLMAAFFCIPVIFLMILLYR
ncbi:MAG: hypothetical protein ACR2OR_06335 [Hyphomicrobiales bacterium]